MHPANVENEAFTLREENEQLRRENNALKVDIAFWKSRHLDAVGRENLGPHRRSDDGVSSRAARHRSRETEATFPSTKKSTISPVASVSARDAVTQWSARFSATMFSIFESLALWNINELEWLSDYLRSCAFAGGSAPDDVSEHLPWNIDEQLARTWKYSGRTFTESELDTIRTIIGEHTTGTHTAIARRACEQLGWYRADGGLKSSNMVQVLNTMEADRLLKGELSKLRTAGPSSSHLCCSAMDRYSSLHNRSAEPHTSTGILSGSLKFSTAITRSFGVNPSHCKNNFYSLNNKKP